MTDTQQAKESLADIEARHKDIIKLENSICELHDMFMDLAILVENQGEMIDRIQFHVSSASEYIDDAVPDTNRAMKYQRKSRRKNILILICIIMLSILILLLIGGTIVF